MHSLLKLISWIFEFIPRKYALLLGRKLGSFFYYFIPIRKAIAVKNISIAFPKLNKKERTKLLYSTYQHFGMVLIDFLRLNKYKREKDINLVKIPSESIKLFKENNGGILLSAHLGNWEYLGSSLGLHEIQCVGVAQIQHSNGANTFFNELRESKMTKIISVNAGSKMMIKSMIDGAYLGLISDQNAGKKGSSATFFGTQVSVPKGVGVFHVKTNSPILLGFCILLPDFSYDLSFKVLDFKDLPNNIDEAVKIINQKYTMLLEQKIREYPNQYFWFHRKWPKKIYKGLSNF